MSGARFEPLRSLARNAQRRHMEMQCDPSWVLDVFDERDALRAENVKLAEWYSEAGVREDTLRAEVERLRNRRVMIPTGEVLDALEELRAFTLEHDSGRAGVLRGKIDAILRCRESSQ